MINVTENYRQQSEKRKLILIGSLGIVVSLTLIIGVKLASKSSSSSESVTTIEPSENPIISPKKPISQTEITPTKENISPIAAIVPPTLEKRTPLSPPSPVTPPQISSLKPSSVTPKKTSSPRETVIIPSSKPKEQPILTIIPDTVDKKSSPKNKQNKPITSQPVLTQKKAPTLVLKSPSEVPTFSNNSNLDSSLNDTITDSNVGINTDNTEKIEPEKTEPKYKFENVEQPPLNDTESLFDYTPQIAEVRQYFQENWQPPQDFQQSLQYRLIISKSGYIQSIIPIGFNAELYLSQVKFPPASQPFVSPFPQSQIVRLVIQPDGNILTFLDN